MLSISGVVHTFLRLRSMQPGRTLNNIVYTTTNEYSMYVTYRSERRKQHPGTTANCPKTSKQRRVRTSFRPRRDTRKRGHEYQFPGRVPLKKPSGVDFLQTSHEISKFPGCTCTQRSMTREIRWRSRSSNAIKHANYGPLGSPLLSSNSDLLPRQMRGSDDNHGIIHWNFFPLNLKIIFKAIRDFFR